MLDETDKLSDELWLRNAAREELSYIRALGRDPELILATANLGGYEAILQLIASGGAMPVYELIAGVQSRYASHSGIISRIKAMRDRGLLESSQGPKKSQVCLAPSQSLLTQLGPILMNRSNGRRGGL